MLKLYREFFICLIFVVFLVSSSAKSQGLKFISFLDLIHTSNANLTLNGSSDQYLNLYLKSKYQQQKKWTPQLKLAYKGSFAEKSNDFFNLSTGIVWERALKPEFDLKPFFNIFSKRYIHQDSRATDNSFSNYGFDWGAKIQHRVIKNLDLEYSGTHVFKNYSNFSDRVDNNFIFSVSCDYEGIDLLALNAELSLNWNSSSMEFYQHSGSLIFLEAIYQFRPKFEFVGWMEFSYTVYANREILSSDRDPKSRFRNPNINVQRSSLTSLAGGIVYLLSQHLSLKGNLRIFANSSNNPLAEYSGFELSAGIGSLF